MNKNKIEEYNNWLSNNDMGTALGLTVKEYLELKGEKCSRWLLTWSPNNSVVFLVNLYFFDPFYFFVRF